MSKSSRSIKAFLPALGIVFGTAVGIVVSTLWDFQIAYGIVLGAAIGLLFGLISLYLYRGKVRPLNSNRK